MTKEHMKRYSPTLAFTTTYLLTMSEMKNTLNVTSSKLDRRNLNTSQDKVSNMKHRGESNLKNKHSISEQSNITGVPQKEEREK